MNSKHFQKEFERASAVWGEQFYPNERLKVFWNAMYDLSDQWLTKTMDYLIGNERFPPLLAEFKPHISQERERRTETEKRQRQEVPEEECTLSREKIRALIGNVFKPMPETVDKDW